MLDRELTETLRQHLTNLRHPIILSARYGDDPASEQLRTLIGVLSTLSPLISVTEGGDPAQGRKPGFTIAREGTGEQAGFDAIPMGHEFTSLVLALLHIGGHPGKISDADIARTRAISRPVHFETFMSLHCQSCPDTVQALNLLCAINPKITRTAIDGALFRDEVETRGVMAVPTVFMDGESFGNGRMGVSQILDRLDGGASRAESLSAREPYDVLLVGGGPAGAAAAVYATRKGLRTGVVCERFGGQVLDTQSIENFISVTHTDGPRLAADMEQHVRSYGGGEIMDGLRVDGLAPGDGLHTVTVEGGGSLRSRTVILATGASWRTLNVPGENELRAMRRKAVPVSDEPVLPVATHRSGRASQWQHENGAPRRR